MRFARERYDSIKLQTFKDFMKKLSLLLLLGIFSSTCLTATDRRKKDATKRKAAVTVKQEEIDDEPTPTATTTKPPVEAKGKKAKVKKEEGAPASTPTPSTMREAGASSSDDELTWEKACGTKISQESLMRIMQSGVAPFKKKQQSIRDYLITQGFSPLAAACFVAFDFSDLQILLPDGAEQEIPALLAQPGFVRNDSELNLLGFFKDHITPFMFLAMNGRSINEILKWVVTRIQMFGALEKKASGLHALLISGVGADIINAFGTDIRTVMVEEIAGCPTYVNCALMSQSLATIEACVTVEVLTTEHAAGFNLATPAEDLATLQALGMEHVLGRFDIGQAADSLDIDAFIRSIDVKSLMGKATEKAGGLQPKATELVDTLKLRGLLSKISSYATLNLILDKLAEAELLTSADLMKLGAKLTALGAARGASSTLGSAKSALGKWFGSSDDAGDNTGDE